METVLRVVALYLFIMASLRVLGKREFAELSPFDLVMLLLVSEIASQALVREDFSMTNALVGLSTLFLLVFLTSVVTFWSQRARTLVSGTPTVLVYEGKLVRDHLRSERIPPDAVYEEMHRAGHARIEQIRWAILESDGRISFVPYGGPAQQQAPTEKEIVE